MIPDLGKGWERDEVTSWRRGWPGSESLLCCRLSIWSWVRQSLCGLISALRRWGAACSRLREELGVVITMSEKMSCTGWAGWEVGSVSQPCCISWEIGTEKLFVPKPCCFSGAKPSLLFPYWAVLQSLNCLKHISVCLNALKISFWTGINPLETPCDPWLLQPEEIIDFKAGRFITLLRSFVLWRFGWRKTNLIQREMF